MTALLVSHRFRTLYGDAFLADATARGIALEYLVLPDDPEARLADELAARAEVAYFSSDVFPKFGKPFFSATRKAADRVRVPGHLPTGHCATSAAPGRACSES